MSDIVRIGTTAVSPENPSGGDARYEPEYEEIQAEIEKLASPTSDGAINWGRIATLGIVLLTEKSKNLLIASYLFVALLESRGAAEIGSAMAMYRGLIENFWDTLYPPRKRMKARVNALEWWVEKVQGVVESFPGDVALEADVKAKLIEDLTGLDAFLGEHLEGAPLLHPLRNRLDAIPALPEPEPEIVAAGEAAAPDAVVEPGPGELADSSPPPPAAPAPIPKEAPAAPAPKPKAAPAAAAPKPAPSSPTPVDGDADPESIFRIGADHFRKAATLRMRRNAADPLIYRLNRIAAWLTVELPPAENGVTLLPPPMDQDKDTLAGLYEKRNYESLLESAEGRVGQYRFWLDLSRYVSEALFHLGSAEARRAVDDETGRYVARLPGIETFSFSDGAPFADEKTRAWLREITRSAGPDISMAASIPSDGESALVADMYDQARALADEGKPGEGLDLLQARFAEAPTRKSRLLWRMNFVRYLVAVQQPRLALPHVREILEDLDRYALEAWDPGFALNALVRAYEGLKHQPDDRHAEEREAVLDRIGGLNPAAALRLV